MKKLIALLSILSIATLPCYSASSDAGTSSAVFLRMEQGARALGMGGAFVALDKDVESVWWNPAALVYTDGVQVGLSYSDYISDLKGSYAAVSIPSGANRNASFMADINYLSLGSVDGRDSLGNPTKSISLNNVYGGVGYAFPTAANISFGAHVKYLQQTLGDFTSTGFVADLGLIYKFTETLSMGVCAQNIGPKIKTSDVENQLPLDTRVGLAYIPSTKFILTADEEMPNDADNHLHIGGEYKLSDSFFLRAGYNSSDAVGFSAGAGFLTPISIRTQKENSAWWKEAVEKDWKHDVIRIDYAYISSAGNFEATHRITASLKF